MPLTRFSDERIFRFSATPDQKRWAIVRGNIASDVVLVSERSESRHHGLSASSATSASVRVPKISPPARSLSSRPIRQN